MFDDLSYKCKCCNKVLDKKHVNLGKLKMPKITK